MFINPLDSYAQYVVVANRTVINRYMYFWPSVGQSRVLYEAGPYLFKHTLATCQDNLNINSLLL